MPFEIPYTDQKLIQKKQIRYFSEIFCLLTSEAGVSFFLTKKVLKQQRDVQSYTSNVTSNSYLELYSAIITLSVNLWYHKE